MYPGKKWIKRWNCPFCVSWIRTSTPKGKEPAERNFELTASKSASRKLSTPAVVLEELLNESSSKLSSEMVPDLRDCSLKVEDETKTNFTDQEVYLREIIDNNNKKNHKLEQVIKELRNVMLLTKDCSTLKNVSRKIPVPLLYWLSKLGRFNGCFWVSWSFPTGGQKLQQHWVWLHWGQTTNKKWQS